MNNHDFPICPICNSFEWALSYQGSIRDGIFGRVKQGVVGYCGRCGVERLQESLCVDNNDYENNSYRELIGQSHDYKKHVELHDEFSRYAIDCFWPKSFRGLSIADVGCGGGALLDHLRGFNSQLIGIEPSKEWSKSLIDRGYEWHQDIQSALKVWKGKLDLVFSTQVIEHVLNPVEFLSDIRSLLKKDGTAIISTPNRKDILMSLIPKVFPSFFYRVQHRWAFDSISLINCAKKANFQIKELKYIHRYGLANAMHWMREQRPGGRIEIPPFDAAIDIQWRDWLERNGHSDNIYLIINP